MVRGRMKQSLTRSGGSELSMLMHANSVSLKISNDQVAADDRCKRPANPLAIWIAENRSAIWRWRWKCELESMISMGKETLMAQICRFYLFAADSGNPRRNSLISDGLGTGNMPIQSDWNILSGSERNNKSWRWDHRSPDGMVVGPLYRNLLLGVFHSSVDKRRRNLSAVVKPLLLCRHSQAWSTTPALHLAPSISLSPKATCSTGPSGDWILPSMGSP